MPRKSPWDIVVNGSKNDSNGPSPRGGPSRTLVQRSPCIVIQLNQMPNDFSSVPTSFRNRQASTKSPSGFDKASSNTCQSRSRAVSRRAPFLTSRPAVGDDSMDRSISLNHSTLSSSEMSGLVDASSKVYIVSSSFKLERSNMFSKSIDC